MAFTGCTFVDRKTSIVPAIRSKRKKRFMILFFTVFLGAIVHLLKANNPTQLRR
jgi:hypothetical protein